MDKNTDLPMDTATNDYVTKDTKKPTPTKATTKSAPSYTSLRSIELQILEKEGICVIFRADPALLIPGNGYDYKRSLKKDGELKLLLKRIETILKRWKGGPVEYVIVQGNGKLVRKGWENQRLSKIIESYKTSDQ